MDRIISVCSKYRYVLLIFLVGVCLMLLPAGEKNEKEPEAIRQAIAEESLESRLAAILSQMEGVGKTQVLLTIAAGEQTLYVQDENQSTGSDSGTYRSETILVTGTDREEGGLVRQVLPPTYQGAIVVCQGGGSAAVRLAVVEAVSKATGLSADKITVLKMK